MIDYAGHSSATLKDPSSSRPTYYTDQVRNVLPLTAATIGNVSPSFNGGDRTRRRASVVLLLRDRRQTMPSTMASLSVAPGSISAAAQELVRSRANSQQESQMPTKPAKITDGLSKTFLIGEKYIRNDNYEAGLQSDDHGWSEGWDADQMRSAAFPPVQDSDPNSSETHMRLFRGPRLDAGEWSV